MTPTKSGKTLAILGGKPAFAEPLHVGRPNVPDKEAVLERIGDALDRRWLTNGGPLVEEFERRVAAATDVKHCIAVANGTLGLELAVRALGLTGEVIVPAFTFIATAHALAWHGITPIFCDVDPITHTIDPDQVERLITPRTSAILGVHLWGHGCDVKALARIAARHNIALFFDAAHAFGCTHHCLPIGRFGACEIFSFHATKFVHSGEGGAITTNDDLLAERLRLLRNFGFAGYDSVKLLGTNAKMNELAAALGLTSLDHQSEIVAANQANYQTYARYLAHLPGLRLHLFEPYDAVNYQYIVVEVDERTAGLTRDELVGVLFAENVLARRYFSPGCHRAEPFASQVRANPVSLPVTEELARRVLVLPTGMQVDEPTIERIAGILGTAIENAAAVRRTLARRRAA